MKPHKRNLDPQTDLFLRELRHLANPNNPLVRLADQIDWAAFEQVLDPTYHPKTGAPGNDTRLMVGLHYLKYSFNLSDEGVLAMWVENLYWQYFCGEQYLQDEAPINSSSMTRWRKRLGKAGAETLLKETILTGIKAKFLKPEQLKNINVDTTVQTKAIRYPTDARLLNRAREHLVREARRAGVKIKQSYERVGKVLLLRQGRYAHARQMNRAKACTKKLRTNLGRVIRGVLRQRPEATGKLKETLELAQRLHGQKQKDKNKIYSIHEPQVHCIAKGKAAKPYEFGNKASLATTSHGSWVVGALGLAGAPYDGHTLPEQLEQLERLLPGKVKAARVDRGYRGHGYAGEVQVHIDREHRGKMSKRDWKLLKRRSAIEPVIGHGKAEHRLERNRLKGVIGDTVNALLSAAGFNFKKLLRLLCALILRLQFYRQSLRPTEYQNQLVPAFA